MARKIFIAGVIAFIVMAVMEYLIFVSDWVYSQMWWWDIPMHMIGGMWAAYVAAWFALVQKKTPTLFQCLVFAALCGIAVEILEYFSGFGGNPFMPYWVDTVKDLADDLLGAVIAWKTLRYFS